MQTLRFARAAAPILLVAASAHAQDLVSCDAGGILRRMNTTTGAGTTLFNLGTAGLGMIGLTLGPGGDFYYLRTFNQDSGLWKINHTTGATTRIMDVFGSFSEGDLRYNPVTGTMYVAGELFSSGFMAKLNMATGDITPMGTISGMGDPSGIAFNAAGDMYVFDTANGGFQNNPALKRLNPANGAVLATIPITLGGNLATGLGAIGGIEFSPAGTLYMVDGGINGAHLWTINTTTGALTDIGPSGSVSGMTGLVYDPIPAPASSLLLSALALRRRRR